ncbi:MAG: rRNA adenine dimethyltransferase family protein, partial [Candidatus Woesearchaeota archaeon]
MYDKQDQHFMKDKKILSKIANLVRLYKEDTVLEIGAGDGALTRVLAQKCRVIAVEIDGELCEKLKNIENTEVVHANILNYLDQHRKFEKIIGSLPYSISEPLFTKLMNVEFSTAVFVIGSNFFEVLKSNSKLGALIRSFFIVKLEQEIPKTAFEPEPRVDSVLILVRPKKRLSEKDRIIQSLVRQQDKKIKNALLKFYEGKKTKNEVREMLKDFSEELLSKRILELSNEEMEEFAAR